MRLKNKVALITGAAAGLKKEINGIGGATAQLFGLEGAKVVLTDLQEDLGRRTTEELCDSGTNAIFFKLDVTKEEEWEAVVTQTIARFGELNILVNNAGIGGAQIAIENLSVNSWDTMLAVHAKGTFLGTKHVIPHMRRAGGGAIVNVGSMYDLVGSPTIANYHAAKGAIQAFTKAAAVQHAKDNIRINSVHPGHCWTPMEAVVERTSEELKAYIDHALLKRFGTPKEIAYGILYLACDESSYVTGTQLVIDGGWTAH